MGTTILRMTLRRQMQAGERWGRIHEEDFEGDDGAMEEGETADDG